MSDVSKRLTSLFFGVLFVVFGFVTKTIILRPILVVLGIILLTISNSIERNNKKIFIPLFFILFSLFIIALDYLIVGAFKKAPIFSYSIVKTADSTVYNAIGYRVWICNDKNNTFKVDNLYKLGYYCSSYNITAENIDNILPKLYNNFELYQDAYIKVTGRISSIISNQELYMQIYDEQFDDDYVLDVQFNFSTEEITKHKILDEVTLIGKVASKEGNIIKIVDSNFMTKSDISNSNLSYKFDVNSNIYCAYDKELWFKLDNRVYYRSCINSIDINVNNESYDLSFALKNNIVSLDDLKDLSEGFLTNSKDESKIYIYNSFKILECNNSVNSEIILGKSSMSFDDGYCKATIVEGELGL